MKFKTFTFDGSSSISGLLKPLTSTCIFTSYNGMSGEQIVLLFRQVRSFVCLLRIWIKAVSICTGNSS